MADKPVYLTQTAYAEHRGVSPMAVSTWYNSARLVLKDGKIDRDASDELLNSTLSRNRQKNPKAKARTEEIDKKIDGRRKEQHEVEGQPATYANAKVQREHYAALREKLAYELASAKVCDVARASRAVYENAVATRRALERLPDRLGARVAAEPDERKCRIMIQKEVAEICLEVVKIAETLPQQLGSSEH